MHRGSGPLCVILLFYCFIIIRFCQWGANDIKGAGDVDTSLYINIYISITTIYMASQTYCFLNKTIKQ